MRTHSIRHLKAGLAVTTAMMGLCVAPAAWAQQAPAATPPADAAADETADIVVKGFRESLSSALSMKRRETATIDAIKAEDIAEFPDLNLAESLQRIPGVAISRVNGEGRNISVRGLGPEYTRVRINGMEAQSTSGATTSDRGANLGRGFDFNTFASELFSSLRVQKTASAETDEQFEGCLSFFDERGLVARPLQLTVESARLTGERIRVTYEQAVARLVAHEVDHLDGRLYTDRMPAGAPLVPVTQYDQADQPWVY